MNSTQKFYPRDVADVEWEFLLPYLSFMRQGAPQHDYPLRELFSALRYVVEFGCQCQLLPHDFSPRTAASQQARRWVQAGVFEQITDELRILVRVLDGRTLQSTPESGSRAGYDEAKKKRGSQMHIAVDTLGNLLAVKVTAANDQERAQVADLTREIQEVTGDSVEVGFVDQGDTGEDAARAAADEGIRLVVIKHTEAKRGFVLLPRR